MSLFPQTIEIPAPRQRVCPLGMDLSILRRCQLKPVCYLAFTDEEWKHVVALGQRGLLAWPERDVAISITDKGRAALAGGGV